MKSGKKGKGKYPSDSEDGDLNKAEDRQFRLTEKQMAAKIA
jgi:hypothetical protein